MQRRPAHPHCCHRRGVAVVLVAICLTVLFSFVAMSVDLSFIYNLHSEMQRSMDAAALAGASGLARSKSDSETDVHYYDVYARAYRFARENAVNKVGVSAEETQVTIGHWEAVSHTFVPTAGLAGFRPNAVRAIGLRPDLPLFFGPVLGAEFTRVRKKAVAVLSGAPCGGIWGLQGIRGQGSVITDSYNSLEGSYGAGPVYQNGDLCSCQDVDLNGSVQIHGDVMNGEGYDTYIAGGSHEIWGYLGEHSCDGFAVPWIDVTGTASEDGSVLVTDRNLDPFGGSPYNLRLSSYDNLTLPPGDYVLDTAVVTGSATITVTGSTRILVLGDASFGGNGFVNVTGDPHALTIYSAGEQLTVTGTSGFTGTIIAPETQVTLPGDSEYYGTILGETVTFGGDVVIHVDESVVQQHFGAESPAPVLVD